jgi:acetyl esterase/lipase
MGLRRLIAVLLCCTAGPALAGTAEERADRLYAGYTNIIRDIPYKQVDGSEDSEMLSLDLILPETKRHASGAPVVIYIHGGGWSGGERYVLSPTQFKRFTDNGIAVACISYRLAKNGSSALECLVDCKDAARFLAKNAEQYHLDPQRFAARGHSAGGHLTLCTVLVPNDEPLLKGDPSLAGENPRFLCAVAEAPLTTLFHPEEADSADTITMRPGDLQKILGGKTAGELAKAELATNAGREKFILSLHARAPVDRVARVLSPEFWLDGSSPPLLLVHGTTDSLISVRGSRYFKQLGDERGAAVEYVEVKNGWHDFVSKDPAKTPSHTKEELERIATDFLIGNLLKDIR